MLVPQHPVDERQRVQALHETALLDSPPEEKFDRLTRLVQRSFAVHTVLIALVDAERLWVKSVQGMDIKEILRDSSFCGHSILDEAIFEIPDARRDTRFTDNPLVTHFPFIRFYAGAPLSTPDGYRIGSLCLIDPAPRQLTAEERRSLRDFADCVEAEINVVREKQLQKALQESEQRQRLVLEGTRIGTWEWHVATGVTVFNERWAEIVGYTLAELQPISVDTWLKLVHPQDLVQSGELLQQHFSGELDYYDCQCRMKHRQGHWVWVHDRGRVTHRAEDGSPLVMYGTHADVTQQKQAEQQLLESRDQYLSLVSNIPGITYRCRMDRYGTMLYMSRQVKALTGYPASDFIDNGVRSFASIIHPDDCTMVATSITEAVSQHEPWQLEYRILHRSGEHRWVQERGTAVYDTQGQCAFLDGFILDISAEKHAKQQVERQVEALAVINKIASNPDLDLDAQIHQALEQGRQYLGMQLAVISKVENQVCRVSWMAAAAELHDDGEAALQPGQETELGNAFCSKALPPGEVLALQDVDSACAAVQPCGFGFGMRSYIGVSLHVLDRLFGTLNFFASEPRRQPFNDSECMFVRLLARWIGASIERTHVQQRLHKLISQAPGVAFQYQRWPDGRSAFPLSSPGISKIYYVQPEDVAEDASRVFERMHPDDLQDVMQSIKESADKLTQWNHQHRVIAPDGDVQWLKGSATPERMSDGSVLWHGYIYDITEQKNAELQLQRSEARLRGLFELSPLGIALNDFDTRAFIEVNDALLAPTGYTREEFVRLTDWQITPRQYHAQEDIQLQEMESTGRYGPYEKEYIRRDGSRYPVVLNGLLMQDPSGRKLVWSIVEDISERKRQQRVLEKVNERLTLAADSARFGVWDFDVVNNVLQWDDWMFRLYGLQRDDFDNVLHAWQKRIHPEDRQRVENELEQALQGRKAYSTAFRIVWPDGQIRYLQAAGAVSHDAAREPLRMTGINYDVTESKQAERLKSEFVSTVSHELRTPLTSISGSLGLIVGGVVGEVPEAAREMIRIAYTNSQRLTYLINDLLDMEKLIAGKIRLNLQPLPVLPLVRQSIRDIQGYADKFQVRVVLAENSADAQVMIDPQRAAQVLANYLSNAIKYSPEQGTVEVEVRLCGESVRVTVADQGPGIPAGFRDRIFQKFAQADASDRRQKGGTGLGLAITKALAEQMGGSVGFVSETDCGTRFYVEWPLLSVTVNCTVGR